jgi:hypothetical protein
VASADTCFCWLRQAPVAAGCIIQGTALVVLRLGDSCVMLSARRHPHNAAEEGQLKPTAEHSC